MTETRAPSDEIAALRARFEGAELRKTAANHVALSPVSMLKRTALVHPERDAVIYGALRRSWAETDLRCRRLAAALAGRGIGRGDVVAVLAPNTPEMLEAHLAVPMLGAVLAPLNTRLDAASLAYCLEHSRARVLLTDHGLHAEMAGALAGLAAPPLVVDILDPTVDGRRLGALDYETLLSEGDPQARFAPPADEWDALSLNYTSGTTGKPKGVVTSHRGSYVNAVNNAITWAMGPFPAYLWTLPMFHCNGWCFPWTVTLLGGAHVCLRRVDAEAIYTAVSEAGVTHLCGAPIVMAMIADAPAAVRKPLPRRVKMMTAAAPPPAAVIERMEAIGVEVTHVYGLTEVYGPAVVCAEKPEWRALPPADQAALKARQGVPYELQEDLIVAAPDADGLGAPAETPRDGATLGEIWMRGNIVMKGYLGDPAATEAAFAGGWLHTGDLAVRHPDGYVEIRDRAKDIIISGGENISSVEIESVLFRHPAVALAAVVAAPDERWGEVPCAIVELKPGAAATEDELLAFCKERLAGFKRPKRILFEELPKTSTGKIRKHELRARIKSGG